MGLLRIRQDSIKDRKKKTMAELQEENERLTAQVAALEEQVDNTNLALCEVYEQMLGGLDNG